MGFLFQDDAELARRRRELLARRPDLRPFLERADGPVHAPAAEPLKIIRRRARIKPYLIWTNARPPRRRD